MGGRGGKVAGSYTGASIFEPSMDAALDEKLREVPLDNADTEDTTEDTDSWESLRLNPDGLRGGRAGAGCCPCVVDSLLGGNRGGGDGFGVSFWPKRAIFGGGEKAFGGPLGSLPMPLLVEDAVGELAEVERSRGGFAGGRLGLVFGGTLTGLLPTSPSFKAAIRA